MVADWCTLSERGSYESAGERLAAFVRENNIKVLNVAGSRGSKEPGVAAFVKLGSLGGLAIRGEFAEDAEEG